MKINRTQAKQIAKEVRIVRRGFRQILRQAILSSMENIDYLLGFFRLETVNTLLGSDARNLILLYISSV